jgi:hypothetical protein
MTFLRPLVEKPVIEHFTGEAGDFINTYAARDSTAQGSDWKRFIEPDLRRNSCAVSISIKIP